jgi:hypothetical protein
MDDVIQEFRTLYAVSAMSGLLEDNRIRRKIKQVYNKRRKTRVRGMEGIREQREERGEWRLECVDISDVRKPIDNLCASKQMSFETNCCVLCLAELLETKLTTQSV